MEAKLDIPLTGASVNIVRKSGDALCKIIYDKFGCVATIEGVEKQSGTKNQRQAQSISQEKRGEFMLGSGVKISVLKADLTCFPADVVVNAANEDLKHCGGLALALSIAGGPQIQMESDNHVKTHGKLKTGETVVLGPGSLPCRKIIHAVGPELPVDPFNYDVQKAKPFLEKVIWSILNRVEEHSLANVAIPAISSGLFHYPLKECAYTIVSTIKQYYNNLPVQNHHPKEIFLVNNDEPTVQAMERACHEIFSSQQHQSYSQAAGRNSRSPARTPPPSVQMGNVLLTLKKGNIEEQKTDVIVNTASNDLNLSTGNISRAILNKAGPEMQNEIKTARMANHIISTKPYKLSCKEVYHTFCIEKRNGPSAKKILYDSVLECLWTAVASKNSSIAIPAIGTGALGFSGAESARIILDAVTTFAQTYPNKLQIYIVIFPSDDKIFQAFENQMRSLQNGSPPSFGPASGPKHDSDTSRAPTPQISLLGPSDESTNEAKKWLNGLLAVRSHTIKNNFISHFSERDHHQLSRFAENGLLIEEFMTQGHACIALNGEMKEDAVVAALEIEAMLCKIQKDFISEEEGELKVLSRTEVPPKRETVDKSTKEFSERSDAFIGHRLRVTKVNKVENCALKRMFDLKKKQLCCSTSKRMIQRIPAQFCEMISRIGFQAECAPPEDPKYGEGIYFTRNIKAALELWKEKGEEYLYFVEAEVLTGKSAPGKPGLNMPPPVGKDPNIVHDSVQGGPDVSVIFSGYQALPKYIIICKKD